MDNILKKIDFVKTRLEQGFLNSVNRFYNRPELSTGIFLILLVIYFVEIFHLNRHTTMLADDYSYSFVFGTEQRISNFSDIIKSQYIHYFKWGGRIVAHSLAQLFLMKEKIVFDILNSIAFVLLIIVLYLHSVGNKKVYPAVLLMIGFCLYSFTPAFGQNFLWIVGSCNYLWGSLLSLGYLLPYRFQLQDRYPVMKNKLLILVYSLLGIFCSWTNENVGVSLVFLILLCNYMCFVKYRKLYLWGIAGLLGSIVGVILMISAPGNYARLSSTGDFSIVKNFFIVTRMFFSSNYLLYPLAATLCFEILRKKKSDILVTVLYSCGLLSVMYAMTFAPFFPDRAKLCGVLYAIILMCNRYLLINFDNDLVKKIAAIFMVCLLLANIRDFGDALKSIKRYEHEINKRTEYIEKEKKKGNYDLIVKKIYPTNRFNAAWGLSDLGEDSDNWLEKDYARYYGLNSIKAE